jgi:hypothetical protein
VQQVVAARAPGANREDVSVQEDELNIVNVMSLALLVRRCGSCRALAVLCRLALHVPVAQLLPTATQACNVKHAETVARSKRWRKSRTWLWQWR